MPASPSPIATDKASERLCARAPGWEDPDMVTIRNERPADAEAREALLDEAFGAMRQRKTSQRLREGRQPAAGLSFVAAERGRVIGTARLWEVVCGPGRPAVLLG